MYSVWNNKYMKRFGGVKSASQNRMNSGRAERCIELKGYQETISWWQARVCGM